MSPSWSRSRSTSPALGPGTNALFAGKDPEVREIYEKLQTALRSEGPVVVEAKRTSMRLVAGISGRAFAEIHPQHSAVRLSFRTATPIESPRIRRVERVSENRFVNETWIDSPSGVNAELLRWLKAAHRLAVQRK